MSSISKTSPNDPHGHVSPTSPASGDLSPIVKAVARQYFSHPSYSTATSLSTNRASQMQEIETKTRGIVEKYLPKIQNRQFTEILDTIGVFSKQDLESILQSLQSILNEHSTKNYLTAILINLLNIQRITIVYHLKNQQFEITEPKQSTLPGGQPSFTDPIEMVSYIFTKIILDNETNFPIRIRMVQPGNCVEKVKEAVDSYLHSPEFKTVRRFNTEKIQTAINKPLVNLYIGAAGSDPEYLQEMIDAGLTVDAKDQGASAFDIARHLDKTEIVQILARSGKHSQFIDIPMRNLATIMGYNWKESGSCNGIAYKFLEAFLLDEVDRHVARLENMLELDRRFGAEGRSLESLDAFLISKYPPIASLETMSKEEKLNFALEDIKKIAEEIEIGFFIDLLSYLDSIQSVYRDLKANPGFFPDIENEKSFQRHRLYIFENPDFATSIATAQRGGTTILDAMSIMSSQEELENSLETLQELVVMSAEEAPPLGLFLNLKDHAVALGYNPKKRRWEYINANAIDSTRSHTLEEIFKDLLLNVTLPHSRASFPIIIRPFCLHEKTALAQSIIDAWKQTPSFQTTISITTQKINTVIKTKWGFTSTWLINSVICADLPIIRNLIEAGADINLPDSAGSTPLMHAVNNGNIEVTHLLLVEGAAPTTSTKKGYDALILSMMRGYKEIERALIATGTAQYNRSFLRICEKGNQILLNFFLSLSLETEYLNAIDINCIDDQGNTALMLACKNGHKEIVNILLKNNASMTVVNSSGDDAFTLCVKNGYLEILASLLCKIAESHLIDWGRFSELSNLARSHGKAEIIDFLSQQLS